jgi:hypothetical protein
MSLSRPATRTAEDIVASNTVPPDRTVAPREPAPSVAKPPAANRPSPTPTSSGAPPTPDLIKSPPPSDVPPIFRAAPPTDGPPAAPPTDPFHDHTNPIPDGFAGPIPTVPLDPGGPGGKPGPGGTVSPTPEPGSILLIATGLGIFGVLRRRRLV